MSPDEFVVVMVTASSADEAAHIGRALVEDRLAACANVVGPIRSIYRWEGAVEDAAEHLLVIKARAADFAAVERLVRELHSYDVPEVIALPLRAGSAPYLAWLGEATRQDG
jgi:periplasmic divalent cation tolerance protein